MIITKRLPSVFAVSACSAALLAAIGCSSAGSDQPGSSVRHQTQTAGVQSKLTGSSIQTHWGFSATTRGKVTKVNDDGSVVILGQTIFVSTETVYFDVTRTEISVGDYISVDGSMDGSGRITARAIALDTSFDPIVSLMGVVSDFDSDNQTFRIGEFTVGYDANNLIDFDGASLSNGAIVELMSDEQDFNAESAQLEVDTISVLGHINAVNDNPNSELVDVGAAGATTGATAGTTSGNTIIVDTTGGFVVLGPDGEIIDEQGDWGTSAGTTGGFEIIGPNGESVVQGSGGGTAGSTTGATAGTTSDNTIINTTAGFVVLGPDGEIIDEQGDWGTSAGTTGGFEIIGPDGEFVVQSGDGGTAGSTTGATTGATAGTTSGSTIINTTAGFVVLGPDGEIIDEQGDWGTSAGTTGGFEIIGPDGEFVVQSDSGVTAGSTMGATTGATAGTTSGNTIIDTTGGFVVLGPDGEIIDEQGDWGTSAGTTGGFEIIGPNGESVVQNSDWGADAGTTGGTVGHDTELDFIAAPGTGVLALGDLNTHNYTGIELSGLSNCLSIGVPTEFQVTGNTVNSSNDPVTHNLSGQVSVSTDSPNTTDLIVNESNGVYLNMVEQNIIEMGLNVGGTVLTHHVGAIASSVERPVVLAKQTENWCSFIVYEQDGCTSITNTTPGAELAVGQTVVDNHSNQWVHENGTADSVSTHSGVTVIGCTLSNPENIPVITVE